MSDKYYGYIPNSEDDAPHYGTPRHSGRYPWGSGKNPQRNKNFLSRAKELQKQGLTSTQIANAFGMSTTQYRALYSIAKDEAKADLQRQVQKLHEKGMSKVAIGKQLSIPDTTVGNYLKPAQQERTNATKNIASMLKDQIEEKPYLDVGKGVERQLGISKTQLDTAVALLEQQGYQLHSFNVEQLTNPGHYTEVKVLAKGDKPKREKFAEIRQNQDKITSPGGVYFEDYGDVMKEIKPPVNIDSKRISIRYAEDGGKDMDGVIELRKGVPDIALGDNRYAQVRIAVDGTHYLKGMAMYADDLPKGVDIRFNTNKTKDVPMLGEKDHSVLKPLKGDVENPFGAITRQLEYSDAKGKKHQSAINLVNTDEDWDKWSKNLASQFLSKQPISTAKQQLNLTYKEKEKEFKEICELTNPTVKRKLLESFADDCDSAAVHLKAAAFPRQATHVILPINSLKDNEVYAPNYKQGEEVVLVRYPHAGKFEMPRLIVNNNNKDGISLLGKAAHAIGINSKVAEQLSGADFDGDTVVVIPTIGQKIQTAPRLKQLENFDPKEEYPAYPGMKRVGKGDGFHKQRQMGDVSNLITDMTIKGATTDEIARAVKHSMVVIDAEKHNLNWKQSAIDNDIAGLKETYQGGRNKGASTLISKAKGRADIPQVKELTNVSSMTPEQRERYKNGERIFVPTGEKYEKNKVVVDPDTGKKSYLSTGVYKDRLTTGTKMEFATDAYSLSSGSPMESVYAQHANKLKALANEARKEYRSTGRLQMNPSAKAAYKEEVNSLLAKLNIAAKNAPLERQAQLIANKVMAAKIKANPDWEKDDIKKHRSIEIASARERVGSKSRKILGITISDREWEAIQAGAISDNTLQEILRYTDIQEVQRRATPRVSKGMSVTAKARARTLLNMGRTQAEVADELGVSVSTLNKELGEIT